MIGHFQKPFRCVSHIIKRISNGKIGSSTDNIRSYCKNIKQADIISANEIENSIVQLKINIFIRLQFPFNLFPCSIYCPNRGFFYPEKERKILVVCV